jgi:hypothetical protein
MTARRQSKRRAAREDEDQARRALLKRLADIRAMSARLRLDPRESTELLRELRESGGR